MRGGDADLCFAGAAAQAQLIRHGDVSARELVDAMLERIEVLDPRLNAYRVVLAEQAREQARRVDRVRTVGHDHPLHGVPVAVKDTVDVAGEVTTWGTSANSTPARDDAPIVSSLRAAGAIIIGKTNVPEGLTDWQSYNDVYGTTKNPWDLRRTPGGSSGGAAAALAAGFVPLELGGDTGGSLRIPAHFCGVFAHKPSLDLIPQRGSGAPQTPAIVARSELSVIGPMARSAADIFMCGMECASTARAVTVASELVSR
jgi:amidase